MQADNLLRARARAPQETFPRRNWISPVVPRERRDDRRQPPRLRPRGRPQAGSRRAATAGHLGGHVAVGRGAWKQELDRRHLQDHLDEAPEQAAVVVPVGQESAERLDKRGNGLERREQGDLGQQQVARWFAEQAAQEGVVC